MADTIKVTAGKGRRVPIDKSVATAPGDTVLFLEEGTEIEVDPGNTHVIRSLDDGDLVRVDEEAPQKPERASRGTAPMTAAWKEPAK